MLKDIFEGMKTILVIDDNDGIRENTQELLELSQYHVLSAKDGNAGLTMARAQMPDLILCDIMMPDTNGSRFLRLARLDLQLKDIPIIVFSSGSWQEFTRSLIGLADGIIKKPFSEIDLLSEISRVFGIGLPGTTRPA